MKKLLAILMLCAAPLMAAEQIQLYLSITNTPVTGDTLTINGTTRTWTNAHSSLTILTNLAAFPTNTSTTNLYFNLAAYQITERPIVLYNSSNELRMIFQVGTAVTASEAGDWANFTYVTNTITTTYGVRVPHTVEDLTVQTNVASGLVHYLQKATNSLLGGWAATTNMPFLAGANVFTGTNSFTQSFMDMPTLTNVLNFTGIMGKMTNGYGTNQVFDSPTMTNAVVYGGFRSHGAGANSLRLGSNVTASGQQVVAVGDSSSASGFKSIAVGQGATASSPFSIVIGQGSEGSGGDSIVLGTLSAASKTNGITIGNNSINDMTNTIVIGNNITATQTNQILIGSISQHITVPGRVEITGTQSNTVFTATNRFGVSGGPYANVQYRRYDIGTVANGANLIDLNGATYVKLTGPTAAHSLDKITGGQDGYFVILTYVGGEDWTIANESGSAGGAATDRILTGTGADIGPLTNNPASVTLIYDSGASRWNVLNHSN